MIVSVTYQVRPKAEGWPWQGFLDDLDTVEAVVSYDHPTGSRGLPVLLINGSPQGPGDLGDHSIRTNDRETVEALEAAGYRVQTPADLRFGDAPHDRYEEG